MATDQKQPNIGDLRVWWIPQVPMRPFFVPVESVKEAVKIIGILADYDIFQFENKIKPDYCNAGGLCRYEADDGNGSPDWCDWYDEETGEDDPAEWLRMQGDPSQP